MTTTPEHTLYRGWQVYEDPAPVWEGARWVGCSDKFETCVSGSNMGEVFADIDDIEEDVSAPWVVAQGAAA